MPANMHRVAKHPDAKYAPLEANANGRCRLEKEYQNCVQVTSEAACQPLQQTAPA